ncbi:MAG: LacI family DNA-binding transcriptional regulator [Eubacteriales bacterium]|nr:LacI family DNA-binding transcriptional regulator [Eubacteriales bacterium]
MAKEVTLKDIAEELNISIVTASNALSGKKGVSEDVRKKIILKAQKMKYDISKYVNKKDSEIKIGVISSNKYLEVGASFYWALYQQVAYAASKKNSVTIFEVLEDDITETEEMPKILMDKSIDCLIIIGYIEESYVKKIINKSNIPIGLLDFHIRNEKCDSVVSNSYIGTYKITKYLIDRGHKEIGFIGSIYFNENIMDRYFGFRKCMMEHKIDIKKEWVLNDRNIEKNEICVKLPKNMPTAFVCNCDLSASFLYDELIKLGYRVPEDISIISYDNYLYGHNFANQITTYNVDMKKMAKEMVKILLKRVKGINSHYGINHIDSEIVERNSVKKIEKDNN